MNEKRKILHIATFQGNIGDNASHIGLNKILETIIPIPFDLIRHEIRDYYKNVDYKVRKFFDRSFVSYVNTFDLVIIGGGGFLDYFVEDSVTGTTFDISIELLDEIKTPILFSSVGCVPNNIVPDGNVHKFEVFLKYLLQSDSIDILFRNDGSKENIEKTFGIGKYNIKTVLDNGFFFDTNENILDCFNSEYIAISVSFDQIDMSGPESIDIDSDTFYNEIAKTIKHIVLNLNLNVCLVPHIYKDLKSIDIVLSKLDDILIRKNIIISPCIQGDYGSFFNFSVYKNSKLIIGTRFHANVCGVSMGVDTIGLAVLKRLGHMYNHIRMPESFLMADNFFSKELCSKIDLLVKGNSLRGQYDQLEVLRKESLDLHSELINKFL